MAQDPLRASTHSALLIDVDAPLRDALASWAQRHGLARIGWTRDPSASSGSASLIVVQIRGRSEDGYEKVVATAKLDERRPIVVLGEDLGADLAFRLARLGVVDVIELPAAREDLGARVFSHFIGGVAREDAGELIGQSPAIARLRNSIGAAAEVDSTVLLQGETGTGKGLVARLIHAASPRGEGPFVHVDCAALSPNLVESELFGHEKGAFTGAGTLRRGRFEMAHGGTIFLDEIGDLDPGLQTKLLRVLEDRQYERVGGSQTLRMRARVIAATSHDLLRAVQEKRFRQDLYFRLNVLKFTIPPLRDRANDLPLLVHAGLRRHAASLGVPIPRVADDVYAYLADYSWPGNVRELMNLLERLLVHRRVETVEVEDLDGLLDPAAQPPPRPTAPSDEDEEAALARAALIDTGGNISRAARRLGVARGTLRYRIRKYGLDELVPRD